MPIGAILFDKDGTLFDFRATWAGWAEKFLLGVALQDRARATEIGHHIGFDLPTGRFRPDSIVIAATPAEIAEDLAPHLPEIPLHDLLARINDEAGQAPQRPVLRLDRLLDQLRGLGLVLGVATNDAEAPARAHLAGAGILDKFDFIAGFDSGHGAKPAPGQMLAFAAAAGLPPARIAMVGDSLHDLVAGRAAGMRTIGVLTGIAGAPELETHADAILPDIGHLPGWLAAQKDRPAREPAPL